MNKPVSIGARIPLDLDERLTTLAGATGRSKSWHTHQALQRYIDEEMDFIEKVRAGLEDVQQGRLVPHEEVVAQMDELLAGYNARRVD
jgi:predicted transcriptional regulator